MPSPNWSPSHGRAHDRAGVDRRRVHIRDGKVVKLFVYLDREHALADLGLAPEVDAADPPA